MRPAAGGRAGSGSLVGPRPAVRRHTTAGPDGFRPGAAAAGGAGTTPEPAPASCGV